MKLFKTLLLTIALAAVSTSASAFETLAFHCDSDTIRINELLRDPQLKEMNRSERVAHFARRMIGCPSNLRSEILESDSMVFTLNVHSFNPLSLISTCIALAQAYETSSAPGWRDYADRYESVMYKSGKARGFLSRFLYASDWIADNIFRNNVNDATLRIDQLNIRKKEKSIDYISRHREAIKALSDSTTYERLRMLEMGFRNHQIPYISNGDLTNPKRFKQLAKDGDIFFLLAPDNDLDSREMGILTWEGDKLMIIHVSPTSEKVEMEALPFEAYVKRNIKRIKGARIIRVE
ncbi:MAG: DUF1460 domain-containing protein [Muribaculaceae bacterium]|nr:DUF1460 domain-containing protein [Muribaculaceae bacterium]